MQPAFSQESSSLLPSIDGVNSPLGYLEGLVNAAISGSSKYSGTSRPRYI